MISNELKQLRSFFHSLASFELIFEHAANKAGVVQKATVNLGSVGSK